MYKMIDLPTEKELEKLMQEYQKDHPEKGGSIKERAKATLSLTVVFEIGSVIASNP